MFRNLVNSQWGRLCGRGTPSVSSKVATSISKQPHVALERIVIPQGNVLCFDQRWQQQGMRHYCSTAPKSAETVAVTYVEADGSEKEIQAEIGKNLMETAHDNNIELEGACGGELACSTCHLIFEQDIYDNLPEKDDEEDDMLDLAFEVTDTSRLGCQIVVTEDMEGMKVKIPDDGF